MARPGRYVVVYRAGFAHDLTWSVRAKSAWEAHKKFWQAHPMHTKKDCYVITVRRA